MEIIYHKYIYTVSHSLTHEHSSQHLVDSPLLHSWHSGLRYTSCTRLSQLLPTDTEELGLRTRCGTGACPRGNWRVSSGEAPADGRGSDAAAPHIATLSSRHRLSAVTSARHRPDIGCRLSHRPDIGQTSAAGCHIGQISARHRLPAVTSPKHRLSHRQPGRVKRRTVSETKRHKSV